MSDTRAEGEMPGFGMTDLEEQLRGADGAARAAALVERLSALSEDIDRRIGEGLAPDAFRDARTVQIGLAAARHLMVSTCHIIKRAQGF